ncbi:MAG: toxin [Gammaproteobacteria bacterium]
MDLTIYDFDPDKNAWLIENRGISFEQILAVLESKGPIDVINHPNTVKYPHQQMYVVELQDYIYLVPFAEQKGRIFLKTAFPNRKAVKQYGHSSKGGVYHD